jgi:hypothetical protein
MKEALVLCYVDGPWAYFTTQPLREQWGDDWSDAPYEHNAGPPYEPCWHNEPQHRSDPTARRGWKPGTQTPLDVGEVCRCVSCQHDWHDDGTPKYRIVKVAWDGPFVVPCDGCLNSQWSVEQINAGAVAWLASQGINPPVAIVAGTLFDQFVEKVQGVGGTVYFPGGRDPQRPRETERHGRKEE